MIILGINRRTDSPMTYVGSATLIEDGKIVYAIEQERLSRNRYALGERASVAIKACLEHAGRQLSNMDHIAYGSLPDLKNGKKLSQNMILFDEQTPMNFPSEFKNPLPSHFAKHHYTLAAVTYYTSGF